MSFSADGFAGDTRTGISLLILMLKTLAVKKDKKRDTFSLSTEEMFSFLFK